MDTTICLQCAQKFESNATGQIYIEKSIGQIYVCEKCRDDIIVNNLLEFEPGSRKFYAKKVKCDDKIITFGDIITYSDAIVFESWCEKLEDKHEYMFGIECPQSRYLRKREPICWMSHCNWKLLLEQYRDGNSSFSSLDEGDAIITLDIKKVIKSIKQHIQKQNDQLNRVEVNLKRLIQEFF